MTPDTLSKIRDLCRLVLKSGRWSEEKALASKVLAGMEAEGNFPRPPVEGWMKKKAPSPLRSFATASESEDD